VMCSTFQVNETLSVVCFRRNHSLGPYFAVREFDTKVIRSASKNKKIVGRGPSEQAIRASIRQAILNMALRSERASKAEIRMLKQQGILGKRAPSCALLCAEDMLKLLEAFDRPEECDDLRKALEKEGKKPKEEKELETEPLDNTGDDILDETEAVEAEIHDETAPSLPPAIVSAPVTVTVSTTRTSARIKRRAGKGSPRASAPSPTGLDALLQALETEPKTESATVDTTGSRSRGEKTRRLTVTQTSPEMGGIVESSSSNSVDSNSFVSQFVPVLPYAAWAPEYSSPEAETAPLRQNPGQNVPVSVSVC